MMIGLSKSNYNTLSKLPDRLFYYSKGYYNIFSTKTGAYLGYIKMNNVRRFYPNPSMGSTEFHNSLHIDDLFVEPRFRKKGVGTSLIKFAKTLSKKKGGEGNLHLWSYNYREPSKPTHVFYWKNGFRTTNEWYNKLIGFSAEMNIPVPPTLNNGVTMYFKA